MGVEACGQPPTGLQNEAAGGLSQDRSCEQIHCTPWESRKGFTSGAARSNTNQCEVDGRRTRPKGVMIYLVLLSQERCSSWIMLANFSLLCEEIVSGGTTQIEPAYNRVGSS